MAFDQSKFRMRFIEEAREHIHNINEGLLSLGKNPDDMETLNAIFRSAHTIKGSSRMLKLMAINQVAHKLEDALGALREKKIQYSKDLVNLFFKGVDVITDLVDKMAAGQDITTIPNEICEALEKAAHQERPDLKVRSSESKKPETVATGQVVKESLDLGRSEASDVGPRTPDTEPSTEKSAKSKTDETIRIRTARLDELIKLMGELVSNQSRLKQRFLDIREVERLSRRNLELVSRLAWGDFPSRGYIDDIIHTTQSVHLKLTQLVSSTRNDASLQELLTHDLQEKALRMRMLPLSTVFDSFHRAVWDISVSLEKDVNLIIEGGEIELDKKMIEKIGDPLLHMIRNALDHGIEKPEERVKKGKPPKGTIGLSACYEGGSVLIELSDDGAGIPLQKIKEKALRKNLFDADTLNNLSESELVDLIFYPGLSTSAIITDVSGRGVGMDVVRKNIVEDLKGTIRIETKEGQGTTFYIRLPLTLAIMRMILVTVWDMIFAISTSSISEILRIPKTEIIEVVGRNAIRLREQIIPIVELGVLLNLPTKNTTNEKDLLIIIVYMGNDRLGLIVDSLLDEEDMVIKPLPSHMKNIQWVSGVTITGNNDLVSVLHIPMIIETAKEMKEVEPVRRITREEKWAIHILVVDDSINTREIEKSILEAYGYRVDLAADGVEALEKIKEFKYDLIITDVEMPRLDGFSLTENLRKDPEYKEVPIIIVTSREKEEDKKRGIKVGADAYIIKGAFDQSNLLETVQSLVG